MKNKKIRCLIGYQDTRINNEDLAITPYLFGVLTRKMPYCIYNNKRTAIIIGIGFCWLHSAIYIGFGLNIPKEIPSIKVLTRSNQDI